jgi:hypothetical protein
LVSAAVTCRARIRKTPNIATQTPYAANTPEANDARTAHTNTTESLNGTIPLLSLPANGVAIGSRLGKPEAIVAGIQAGRKDRPEKFNTTIVAY